MFQWSHATLAETGEFLEPSTISTIGRLQLSAEVVLAPVIASLSPATGSTAGGNGVTIAGKYLDGATSVTFGSTRASSFSVDSPGQITAIAPASVASTVDVRVAGPGGSSEVGSVDRYTFTTPASTSTSTTPTTSLTTAPGSALTPTPLTITGFSQSAARWKRGAFAPHISGAGKPPVGTTFSFNLDEPATASLVFSQRVPGRRVRGRCAAATRGNSGKPRCKRAVSAGSLPLAAHAGANKVRFQGRLSSGKALNPGTYSLTVTARDSHGSTAASQPLSFTILSS
jgi:hypothetical protein